MVRDSVSSEDPPSLQAVLDALDDADCRTILRETAEPMTATELIDACDIPKSTVYGNSNFSATPRSSANRTRSTPVEAEPRNTNATSTT
jgi:hypothetical protein